MLTQHRYQDPGFNTRGVKELQRGDDDFARETVHRGGDGGAGVMNKPFNATVTGGAGAKAQNNRNAGSYASSSEVDAIMKRDLLKIIQDLSAK